MKDYDNYLVWVVKFDDICEKFISKGIELNKENYNEILNNLDKYLDIEDIIMNTKNRPFLSNVISSAIKNPNKKFYIVFAELIITFQIEKYLKIKDFNDEFLECFRRIFLKSIEKFFNKKYQEICNVILKKQPEFNKNFSFINYEDLKEKLFINYEKNFLNYSRDLNNKIRLSFQEKVNKKLFSVIKNSEDFEFMNFIIAFKLDLLKTFCSLTSDKNVLVHDFDQIENFDIDIKESTSLFPKFGLFRMFDANYRKKELSTKIYHEYGYYGTGNYKESKIGECIYFDNEVYDYVFEKMKELEELHEDPIKDQPFQFFSAFCINYFPNSIKKPLFVFFEHTIDEFFNRFENLQFFFWTEKSLEILFEYFSSKNFSNNNEILKFFNNEDYCRIYYEFNLLYENFRKAKGFQELFDKFFKYHFINNSINKKLHLLDFNEKIVYNTWLFCHSSKTVPTWMFDPIKPDSLGKIKIDDYINSL